MRDARIRLLIFMTIICSISHEDCVNKLQPHSVILNYEGKQLVCRKPEGDPAAITYGRGLTQLLQGETGLTEATSDHLQPKEGLRDFHGHVRFEILALVYSVIPPFSHSFSLSSTHHLPFV